MKTTEQKIADAYAEGYQKGLRDAAEEAQTEGFSGLLRDVRALAERLEAKAYGSARVVPIR